MVDNSNIFYYHNDHLGTPLAFTNGSGMIVWQAAYNTFDNATVDGSSITNNFRFPGQYYDQETGLHYNYHRYYDPGTGGYVTSDPIGIKGGVNLFVYTMNNPLINIDINGLACTSNKDCFKCLVYAEAGGTNNTCRKAIAWTIKNRKNDPINFPDQNDYCKVAAAPGQFSAFGNERWNQCCDGCLIGQEKTAMEQSGNSTNNLGIDITDGSTFFHDTTIDTPPWIEKGMRKGVMQEVIVSGCNSFRFYKIR